MISEKTKEKIARERQFCGAPEALCQIGFTPGGSGHSAAGPHAAPPARRADEVSTRNMQNRLGITELFRRNLICSRHKHSGGNVMRSFAIALAAAASTLAVTAASAAPLSPLVPSAPDSNIQKVRMVCNEYGRCWHERTERRVIIREGRDAYDYAPRERYYERRSYRDRDGVSIDAPGVSVGIGSDRY